MTDPKFWADNFDMDLPNVLPHAKSLLEDLAELELFTHGHELHGRLNHPTVWNDHRGSIAFFGRSSPMKPPAYVTFNPVIKCTLWEAIRDAWAHDIVILFEGWRPIWDGDTRAMFEPLMSDLRGWNQLGPIRRQHLKDQVEARVREVPYRLRACL